MYDKGKALETSPTNPNPSGKLSSIKSVPGAKKVGNHCFRTLLGAENI